MQHSNLPLLGNVGGPDVVWEPIADREVSNAAQAVIDWTGDYDAVIVDISNARPATDDAHALVELSGDGGSTFDGAPSDYYNRFHVWGNSQVTLGNAQSSGPLTLQIANNGQGNLVDEQLQAQLIIAKPMDPNTKTQIIGTGYYLTSVGPVPVSTMFFLQRDAAMRTDAVRYYYSTGNISEARLIATGLRLS